MLSSFDSCQNDIQNVINTPIKIRSKHNLSDLGMPANRSAANNNSDAIIDASLVEWKRQVDEHINSLPEDQKAIQRIFYLQQEINMLQQRPSGVSAPATQRHLHKTFDNRIAAKSIAKHPSITISEKLKFSKWAKSWLEILEGASLTGKERILETSRKLDSTLNTLFTDSHLKHELNWMSANEVEDDIGNNTRVYTSMNGNSQVLIRTSSEYEPNIQIILGATVKHILHQITPKVLLHTLQSITFTKESDILTHEDTFRHALSDYKMVNTSLTEQGLIDIYIQSIPHTWREASTNLDFRNWDSAFTWARKMAEREIHLEKFQQDSRPALSINQLELANTFQQAMASIGQQLQLPDFQTLMPLEGTKSMFPSKQTEKQTKTTEISKEYITDTTNDLLNAIKRKRVVAEQKPDDESSDEEESPAIKTWPKGKNQNSKKSKKDMKKNVHFEHEDSVDVNAIQPLHPQLSALQQTLQSVAAVIAQLPQIANNVKLDNSGKRYEKECSFCKHISKFDSQGMISNKLARGNPNEYAGHLVSECPKKANDPRFRGMWCGLCPSLTHSYNSCTNPLKAKFSKPLNSFLDRSNKPD
jgi:hypothetical protein